MEEEQIASFYAQAAGKAVREWAEDHRRDIRLKMLFSALVGAVAGGAAVALIATSSCEESSWWNPLASFRSLKQMENSLLLRAISPETSQAAGVASGALLTTGAGLLGIVKKKSLEAPEDETKMRGKRKEMIGGGTNSKEHEERKEVGEEKKGTGGMISITPPRNRKYKLVNTESREPTIYIYPRRKGTAQGSRGPNSDGITPIQRVPGELIKRSSPSRFAPVSSHPQHAGFNQGPGYLSLFAPDRRPMMYTTPRRIRLPLPQPEEPSPSPQTARVLDF